MYMLYFCVHYNYAYWKSAVMQYIDYMQYRRQPMNEIKYSSECMMRSWRREKNQQMTSACILKPVCEHQEPEHHEPVTGKYWKWLYN